MTQTLIAVPCMDEMPYRFVESLIALRTSGQAAVQFLSGSLIYDARNRLLQYAIDNGYEKILWLDSDMVFEPDLLERLEASMGDADLISAVYWTRRGQPRHTTIYKECGYKEKDGLLYPYFVRFEEKDLYGIQPIEACGFGAVLMKTELGKNLLERYGLPFNPNPGFGEDLSFCLRAKDFGAKMICNTRIQIGHVSNKVIYGPDD